ncbi:MAG TPA: aspartate carbamoyltransferase [Acidobacteriaceae bacterium]|nr:aspartate carbamoyltransferase [Acidobacteriaceae bacterium]
MKKLRHVIRAEQLVDPVLLDELFASADDLERDDKTRALKYPLQGRILATMFYEPSTRTRFSFEAAMQKLGGGVLTAENALDNSSASKGETIADTVRVVSGYADAIVLRHPQVGTAETAAEASPVPIINAGDGAGEHPTQALIDVYTIRKELGRLEDLNIALLGDLKNGRTIHSLLPFLIKAPGVSLTLISPPQLRLPGKYIRMLQEADTRFAETTRLARVQPADVVYVTRVQRERFSSAEEYDAVKDSYRIDLHVADSLKTRSIILHALPRTTEILPEVDQDARAAYFRQARNGLYVRMALLKYLMD